MTELIEPRIVCAACLIHDLDGKTYTLLGARHWDMFMHEQMESLQKVFKDRWPYERRPWTHRISEDQGFIDQFKKYYTREEAWKIAEANGQILREVSSPGELYSENLY